ncbi:DUF4962 domain-containing protein [Methanogenium sp. S4BF]|uniref:hypothetical protein n=1 Tax=Methanogenium sp. S4BF TaxID=1789226 RepID=UPI0024169E07|nr:hypothetical protein [Methanogenium sp. S4BF]WFN35113.1 DUF4962 domain-containing protein [Methanogenium sp. S4BF]
MTVCCSFPSAASHPNLLFSDITEVPGYQYSSSAPWNTWNAGILRSADASLSRDFSNPNWATYNRVSYRSGFAGDLALAYQITKDQKYLDKARQALLNLDVGDAPYDMDRAVSLNGYSLAYDWAQPGLTSADDTIIRDKLAILADRTYRDLNGDGTKKTYVTFADYHGQAYPGVAIAGLALEDYTNPNNIPLNSGPEDWIKAGTDYLFVNDELHTYNRPLISFGFDEASGKHLLGAYKTYVIDDLLWWFQVYSNHYDRNILDDYPVAKKIVTSELWETMPNGYMNNYVTAGNTLETYQRAILSLLNDQEKGEVLRYLDQTKGDNLLPYSRENDLAPTKLLFCVYGNYNSISRDSPDWTSRLDEDAIYQVFREDWQEDSDWLSLVTFNVQTNSNRDMAHHDQLSIEYYGNGDLLLADAGETKHVLDTYYGQYGVHHNSIEIEDPQTPFTTSSWADSQARGIYKGDAGGIDTPVTVETVIQTPWMEGIAASETISTVIDNDWSTSVALTSPIQYTRTILYPDDDYFVVFDSLTSDQEWIYRNVLRPSSLEIIPTEDKNGDNEYVEAEIGHVKGSLTINGDSYNWLSLPYKQETETGIRTNSISWETSNPYKNQVLLSIFSVPSSEIIITKHVGRIAGYDAASEVFTPIVYLRSRPAEELSRITVLMSGYLYEERKQAVELPVTGTGNALQINSASNTDTIYSGKGDVSFDVFETDAAMLFYRQPANSADYYCMISGGTYLRMNGREQIAISQTDPGMEATVNIPQNTIRQINRDGMPYTGFEETNNGSAVKIFSDKNNSAFEIQSKGQTAHIILLNEFTSPDSSQTFSIADDIPEKTTEIFPAEQKTGSIATSLMTGIIVLTGIGWCARRNKR